MSEFDAISHDRSGIANNLLEFFNVRSNEFLSGYGRRVLLIVLVVIGSTIALSALIAAMQGFNQLVAS